ncbi:unnamed protein product [Lactuca virosa]|uniref:Uncharacterized protein n=1 Tax=Lactuca virosa TaxID=75947 RepID=A0AAU9LKI3_9ASTR|nr:unnamed protein product [Lactuca virosa]
MDTKKIKRRHSLHPPKAYIFCRFRAQHSLSFVGFKFSRDLPFLGLSSLSLVFAEENWLFFDPKWIFAGRA